MRLHMTFLTTRVGVVGKVGSNCVFGIVLGKCVFSRFLRYPPRNTFPDALTHALTHALTGVFFVPTASLTAYPRKFLGGESVHLTTTLPMYLPTAQNNCWWGGVFADPFKIILEFSTFFAGQNLNVCYLLIVDVWGKKKSHPN